MYSTTLRVAATKLSLKTAGLKIVFMQFVQAILNEARDRLTEVQQDKKRYKELISGLIAQGLFQILEDQVVITCLRDEVDLVQVRVERVNCI